VWPYADARRAEPANWAHTERPSPVWQRFDTAGQMRWAIHRHMRLATARATFAPKPQFAGRTLTEVVVVDGCLPGLPRGHPPHTADDDRQAERVNDFEAAVF